MGPRDVACPWCDGAGVNIRLGRGVDGDLARAEVTCHRCNGTGRASLLEPMRPGAAVPARRRQREPDDPPPEAEAADPYASPEPWAEDAWPDDAA